MKTKKKILILGANGFIGQNIYQKLNVLDMELVSQDRNKCNLLDISSIRKTLIEHIPTIIINCAGIIGSSEINKSKNQLDIMQSNIAMNSNLLLAIQDPEINFVKQVFFFSSYRCFTKSPDVITEDTIVDNFDLKQLLNNTNSGYLLSKVILELQLSLFSKNSTIHVNNLYIPNIFGELDYFNETSRIIPSLIYKINDLQKHNQSILQKDCPSNISLNILYINDLIKIIETSIVQQINCGNIIIYNSKNTFTLKQLLNIVKEKIFPTLEIIFTQKDMDMNYPTFSSTKFDTLFPNWAFTSIDDSLDNTIQYYLVSGK